MQVRSVSYGGGVQSTALLVLAAQGRIDFATFMFANTGDDSEHPATLRYVREVAMPYAAAHGIELLELRRVPRKGRHRGEVETLWQQLMRAGQELRRRGATPENPALVALGISVDELERAKPGRDPQAPYQIRTYPLLDLGLSRRIASESSRMQAFRFLARAPASSAPSTRYPGGSRWPATNLTCLPRPSNWRTS